uniref:Uncharacterized protein n=1 Tax=Arundo donax TaxID=35708 RepID=A0A0A9BZT5_ARUDO
MELANYWLLRGHAFAMVLLSSVLLFGAPFSCRN